MYTIWFIHKATSGHHRIDVPYLDTAQLIWDTLNASDDYAMRSQRP